MFDSMISLILTYDSEAWGVYIKSDFKSCYTSPIDRFHSRDKNLDNRCYAAILVYRNVNKLLAFFAWNMGLCLIVSCGSKSGRDKGLYFVRVPSVVTNQGEEAQKISEERKSRWISAISRDDLTEEILENDRVCEKHLF